MRFYCKWLSLLSLFSCWFPDTESRWIYPTINLPESSGNRILPMVVAIIKSSDNNAKYYELSGIGVDQPDFNGLPKFKIGEESGEITQLNDLDREKQDVYNVVASVFDANKKKLEADITLSINVLDENDNPPIFVDSSLTGSVAEANDMFSPSFMTVQATDADQGRNAEIIYLIVPGSDSPKTSTPRFSINNKTGDVKVVGSLDYETDPKVAFKVEAMDGGGVGPSFRTTAIVTVQVLDSNDHAPVFDDTPEKAVSELYPLHTSLYEVSASDQDKGVNKKVYFAIAGGNVGGTFYIDSIPSDTGKSKGEIKLEKGLDFESGLTTFDLMIKAYNKEASNAAVDDFMSTSTVRIKVTDENEPPIFQNTPYTTTVTEEEEVFANLPPLIRVEAKDLDFKSNQTVVYSIASDPENWFTIDRITGEVTRVGIVDREARSVEDSFYTFVVTATDNYDNGEPASSNNQVKIFIMDINDNPPMPGEGPGPDGEWTVVICEKPENQTVTEIEATDPDDSSNGPPFAFMFASSVSKDDWGFQMLSPTRQEVLTYIRDFDLDGGGKPKYELPYTITDHGSPTQTGTSTLTVSICKCLNGDSRDCSPIAITAGGFPFVILIIIAIVLLVVIILALLVYKRRQAALTLKEPFFEDEDDVRENLQVYQEEGGEEDQEAYDLTALRAPLMEDPNAAIRVEKPLQQAPRARMPRAVPDDIGDYIGDAKDQADNDPSAPPFDSLLVFDYEGLGSDAGSLSSINTATTDGSMDYDHLNDWGPRFRRLADMYNAGSDSE